MVAYPWSYSDSVYDLNATCEDSVEDVILSSKFFHHLSKPMLIYDIKQTLRVKRIACRIKVRPFEIRSIEVTLFEFNRSLNMNKDKSSSHAGLKEGGEE